MVRMLTAGLLLLAFGCARARSAGEADEPMISGAPGTHPAGVVDGDEPAASMQPPPAAGAPAHEPEPGVGEPEPGVGNEPEQGFGNEPEQGFGNEPEQGDGDEPEPTSQDEPCVVQDVPAGQPQDCNQLDALVLEHAEVHDDGGDGVLSPGEGAELAVTWRETAGLGVSWYPGVVFSSATPGVVLGEADWRYAALACHVEVLSTRVSVPPELAAGARIVVQAQVAMLDVDCPRAAKLEIPIVVGEPLR